MACRSRRCGGVAYLAIVAAVAAVGGALFFAVRTHKSQEPRSIDIPLLSTFYPEPDFLLQHAVELKLSVSQKRHIEIAQREWSMKKAGYNQRLRSYGSDTEGALATLKAHRVPQGDEGKAVLDFDAGRSRAWSNATKPLDPHQVEKLDKLREATEHPKTSLAENERYAFAEPDSMTLISPNSESEALTESLANANRSLKEIRGAKKVDKKLEKQYAAAVKKLSQRQGVLRYLQPPGLNLPRRVREHSGLQPIPTTPITLAPQLIPLWKGEAPAHLIAPKLASKARIEKR